MTITKKLIAESHRRQFEGEDWQAVAQDICDRYEDVTEDQFNELTYSPDPGCDCGFCAKAQWRD